MSDRFLFDTNAVMLNPDYLSEVPVPVIPYKVLQELDKLKMEADSLRGWQARRAMRKIKSMWDDNLLLLSPAFERSSNVPQEVADDNIIIAALNSSSHIVSGDFVVQAKIRALKKSNPLYEGLRVIDAFELVRDDEDRKGWQEVLLNHYEAASFFENLNKNHFGLYVNQYLVVNVVGNDECSCYKWNGVTHIEIKRRQLECDTLGKFKAKDAYQMFALDSLLTNQMTMIKGKAGSGKSLLALTYAMHLIEKGNWNKLIVFCNPVSAKNAAKTGFKPGNRNEKLLDSAVGSTLNPKFGGRENVLDLIHSEQLLLLPFEDIRGFDTTGMKAIVYIMEAQNLNVELMKLGIQRISEDSKLIIDGDYNQQVDMQAFEGSQNGMRRASEIFHGCDYFGEVELPIIYRSKIAARADLM